MSKPAKSSHRNKRYRKQPTQPRRKSGAAAPGRGVDAGLSTQRPAAAYVQNSQNDGYERIRGLWERKQAELESRRVAAQARQTTEEMARRRATKILYGTAGIAALVVLLFALALYYTYGVIQFPGLLGQEQP